MHDPRSDRFIRSRLKTRHLVLLSELGQHRSILHAAESAHMTQSAASKLLSELEQVLGAVLFERLPRGVAPTPYGEIMIRRARAALAELSLAHQEVMVLLSGLSGRVGVGTVMTPASTLLPAAVQRLKELHEKLHVAIEIDASRPLLERLRAGAIDIMVGRILDQSAADELDFEPLNHEPHSVIARSGHPLQGRADLGLADLTQVGWVLPAQGSILRDRLTSLFLSSGFGLPERTIETTALPFTTQLLAQSDMVAALPVEVVQTQVDAGLLATLPIELGLRLDPYGIVTRKNHVLSPGARAMLQALRETAHARKRAASGAAVPSPTGG